MSREFTEQEVISALTAVIRYERSRRPSFSMTQLLPWVERQEEGNRRLLEYARTGDVSVLESAETARAE